MSFASFRRLMPTRRFRPSPLLAILFLILPIAALSLSCTEQQQMELTLALGINQMRTDAGLPPLTVDPALSAIALARAEDMATNNYFDHMPPNGCNATCMMRQAGLSVGWTGEVLAWNDYPVDSTVAVTIKMWHDSADHYAVITNACFIRMGTGAVIAANGHIYHAAVFEGRAAPSGPCAAR